MSPELPNSHASPIDRTVSFRTQLSGQLSDFLEYEGLACADTTAALVALVARLATYTEEGVPLFPEVYVCSNIEEAVASLPFADVVRVGKGKRTEETAVTALKECAPLATGGWKVFVERQDRVFVYGLFRGVELPIAITPEESLIEEGSNSVPIVLAAKVATNCVEVRGARGNKLRFHFSSVREESPSPREAIERLTRAIAGGVEARYRNSTCRFLSTVLVQSFQGHHGALAMVLAQRHTSFPKAMCDSVKLAKPIRLAARVAEYEAHKDNEAMSRLQGAAHLVSGMLHSDGIVVFRCDGMIRGYRGFLSSKQSPAAKAGTSGGARRRTFEAMKNLLGKKVIGVFFLSQDGHAEYKGR